MFVINAEINFSVLLIFTEISEFFSTEDRKLQLQTKSAYWPPLIDENASTNLVAFCGHTVDCNSDPHLRTHFVNTRTLALLNRPSGLS